MILQFVSLVMDVSICSHSCVLVSDSLVLHIPICEINPSRNVHATLKRFMQVCLEYRFIFVFFINFTLFFWSL